MCRMRFVDLGCRDFRDALTIQEAAVADIASGREEEIVHFVEHPNVFTVGRGGDAGNLLAQEDWDGNPIQLERIGRGGDVTYHGPGQLVGYPHLDLRTRGRDVHRYLRNVEEVLIETASALGVQAYRRPGLTGVWTDDGKLASIGVAVRRWVTWHGFALNVSTDLRYFRLMNPCGIAGCPVASVRSVLGREVNLDQVKTVVRSEMLKVFGT